MKNMSLSGEAAAQSRDFVLCRPLHDRHLWAENTKSRNVTPCIFDYVNLILNRTIEMVAFSLQRSTQPGASNQIPAEICDGTEQCPVA